MSNFHAFEADSGIVHHLIHNQNGTVETSLIELICNSVDANASLVKITLTDTYFEVEDDGKGFKDKDEIMSFFKKFGTPHKEGDATFGRFRIGRGQIISFTDAVWQSKEFKMKTCIQDNAYGFEFSEDKSDYINGCKVYGNFKEKITSWDFSSIQDNIIEKLKYLDAKVILNGIPITLSDDEVDWGYEDEDVKILWNPRRVDGLKLYSQGVFVKDISNYYYDLNADIVTKNALKLNMARNETNDSDPVWRKINQILIERSQEMAKKENGTRKLNEKSRRGLISQLLGGKLDVKDAIKMSLLKDCRGHTFSFNSLLSRRTPLCFSKKGEQRKSEWLATSNIATILDHDDMRIWDVNSARELINKLKDIIFNQFDDQTSNNNYSYVLRMLGQIRYVEFEHIANNISEDMVTLKNSELNKRESAAKNALQTASGIMANRLTNVKRELVRKRKIVIGESIVADGWTDSITYIAVSKRMLSMLDSGYYGAVQLALLLLHEYIHNKSSFDSHTHDFDFYKQFHDLASHTIASEEIIGHVATSMMNKYNTELCKKMEELPKEIYKNFKYPVVNDLDEYEVFLGKGGLSKLGLFILDSMPYSYKITKKKLILKKPSYSSYEVVYRYRDKILKLAEKAGFEMKNEKALSMEFGHEESWQMSIKDKEDAIRWWLKENGHDESLAKTLNNYGRDGDFIRVLIEDKNSDVLYYEKTDLVRIRNHGSKKHHFNFKAGLAGSFYYNGRKPDDMANDKKERFSEVKDSISHIVNGLKDEKEKKEFMEQFLSKDFKKELDNKNKD